MLHVLFLLPPSEIVVLLSKQASGCDARPAFGRGKRASIVFAFWGESFGAALWLFCHGVRRVFVVVFSHVLPVMTVVMIPPLYKADRFRNDFMM